MVFHEITQAAIEQAVDNRRDIDYGLVDAQETRRILDRLFGYQVSAVLWRKVNGGLSAGRVQSPAIRLVVERERERMAFVAAGYWDLDAAFRHRPGLRRRRSCSSTARGSPPARTSVRTAVRSTRRSRCSTSPPPVRWPTASTPRAPRAPCARSTRSPSRRKPKPPFMTSTLQQEGGRKLRLERGPGHAGRPRPVRARLHHLHAHRLDHAVGHRARPRPAPRSRELYGADYLPDAPRVYASKVKNAQEAHEAIRPAGETASAPRTRSPAS